MWSRNNFLLKNKVDVSRAVIEKIKESVINTDTSEY